MLALFGVGLFGCFEHDSPAQPSAQNTVNQTMPQANSPSCDNSNIIKSYANVKSDVQVKGCGVVIKVLPDDNKGSRHQKMIVRLNDSSQTVLIAHNIDLAPRVANLKQGDELTFYGEYEYSEQGGVIHWTHHDPAGRHQGGWIDKNGQRYE